jgi:hypothetical protein
MVVVVGKVLIIGEFMYRNVLLTDKEISLLKTIISQTLNEKVSIDRNNLTIIHNRLREIKPLVTNNQFFNYGK